MTTPTGIRFFDRSIVKTNEWIKIKKNSRQGQKLHKNRLKNKMDYNRINSQLDAMRHSALNNHEVIEIIKNIREITKKIGFEEEKLNFEKLIEEIKKEEYDDLIKDLKEVIDYYKYLLADKENEMISSDDMKILEILSKKEEVFVKLHNYFSDKVNKEDNSDEC